MFQTWKGGFLYRSSLPGEPLQGVPDSTKGIVNINPIRICAHTNRELDQHCSIILAYRLAGSKGNLQVSLFRKGEYPQFMDQNCNFMGIVMMNQKI